MWRRTRQAISNCFIFFGRCGRPNSSIDGDFAAILQNLEEFADNAPGAILLQIGPQLRYIPQEVNEPRQREPFQHRPDAPCGRRKSPPEVVQKMRLALEEMCETSENRERRVVAPRNDNATNVTRSEELNREISVFSIHLTNPAFDFDDDDDDVDDDWYLS